MSTFHHVTHPHPFKAAADLSRFYVITTVSNPIQFKRRYELYWQFKEMCSCAGVKLITVEQAFGNRQFMVTEEDNPLHVQVRTVEELWHKENMINLGRIRATSLTPTAREVAWVDADCASVLPARAWFEKTWHSLQHYEFVQMWGDMVDLDVNNLVMGEAQPSFMSNYIRYGSPNPGEFKTHITKYPYGIKSFGRPGLAWAANVDALEKVGGLIDYSILGAGDWYMAHALIGSAKVVVGEVNSSNAYVRKILQWQELCERWVKRDVGYVEGSVYHYWHGDKKHRGYSTRGTILVSNAYNPDTDVKYDSQGLLQLETWEPRQIKLRDQIRAYFRARNEDQVP